MAGFATAKRLLGLVLTSLALASFSACDTSEPPSPPEAPSPAERELRIDRADIEGARDGLVRAVFERPSLPSRKAQLSTTGRTFPGAASVQSLRARIDGFTSHGFLLRSQRPPNGLVIVHSGHERHPSILSGSRRQLRFFVERGFDVAALSMPRFAENRDETGPLKSTRCWRRRTDRYDHAVFGCAPRPLAPFIGPVVMTLNRLTPDYELVAMSGLSGGGWATVVSAAMDSRIDRSYPVAGSWPMYLRRADGDRTSLGDFEQLYPPMLRAATYLDMYAMAARQLQVFIDLDPCCFAGDGFRTYANVVRAVSPSFRAVLDRTTRDHEVSAFALQTIARDLRRASLARE